MALQKTNSDLSVASLLAQVRVASADQLRRFAVVADVKDIDVISLELPFLQHMTQILVSGPQLEITIKTHFMTAAAGWFLQQKTGDFTSDAHALDFMKELSNLVAGKTKTMLEQAGIAASQSLPFCIRGYNEVFHAVRSKAQGRLAWGLQCGEHAIRCSASARFIAPLSSEMLSHVRYTPDQDAVQGEAELF